MTHRSLLLFVTLLLALSAVAPTSAAAGSQSTPLRAIGHDCEDEIASTMVFLRLTLVQGTVWNAAFHNLQRPYDYSAGQLGLEMLAMNYPTSKLGVVDAYLEAWNRWGNLDNRELGKITAVIRPYARTLADDLAQSC